METLKKLIRDSTTRDNYIGSPWIVKNAEEYGLPTELPDDLQAKSDKFHGREERERKKQRIANGETIEGLPFLFSFLFLSLLAESHLSSPSLQRSSRSPKSSTRLRTRWWRKRRVRCLCHTGTLTLQSLTRLWVTCSWFGASCRLLGMLFRLMLLLLLCYSPCLRNKLIIFWLFFGFPQQKNTVTVPIFARGL